MRIGVPRALSFFRFHPALETFFRELGAEVVVSPPTTRATLEAGLPYTVAETCLPVKLFFGHVQSLVGQVDVLLAPSIHRLAPESTNCAKLIGLPDMLQAAMPDLPPLIAPDVDLSYDDRDNFAISRRHARIVGRDGRHEIEDMGSTNGTRVNGKRLEIGQQVRLRPGDRVGLGYCEFTYVSLPETNISLRAAPSQAHLWVTFTGQRFPLPTWGEVVVGRSDPTIGLIPDIDLSAVEEAAHVVARRHVKIIARSGSHYIEDLGSANGTKLNGVRIRIGELRLLGSGDHLWLGGCVLAYDVERQPDEQGLG